MGLFIVRSVCLLIGALILSGCAEMQVFAVERFAGEYNCPIAQVQAQEITTNTYVVRGCRQRAIYVCARLGGGEEATCRHER